MTPEEEMQQYEDAMYAALDAQEEVWPMSKWQKAAAAMDAALYAPIKDGEITTIDHEFYPTCDTTDDASETMSISSDSTVHTTNTASGFNIIKNTTIVHTTATTDTTNTHLITKTPIDIPNATILPIARSPTETKIRPEFNTDAEFIATTTTTTTTTTEEEEEEEVRTIIDHEFYTTCDRTDEASDTTITATTIEDEFTTSTTTDISNIMENTTTVHTTDNVPTIHTTTDHVFSDSTIRTTNTTNTNKVTHQYK